MAQMTKIDFETLKKLSYNVHVYRLAKGFEELVRVAHVENEGVVEMRDGEDGPDSYDYSEGIAP